MLFLNMNASNWSQKVKIEQHGGINTGNISFMLRHLVLDDLLRVQSFLIFNAL